MGPRIRTLHRWLSAAFTVMVLANFAVMPLGNETLGMTVGAATLIPLFLLWGTGAYLFVRPWLANRSTP